MSRCIPTLRTQRTRMLGARALEGRSQTKVLQYVETKKTSSWRLPVLERDTMRAVGVCDRSHWSPLTRNK
jgi:hypothetical protein